MSPRELNRDVLAAKGSKSQRLASIERVTAERHGAIRVGSPAEMAQVARIFAAMGKYPADFYDLREAAETAVPVVSTAFRLKKPGRRKRLGYEKHAPPGAGTGNIRDGSRSRRY